jgi:Amt family ammonium transporter
MIYFQFVFAAITLVLLAGSLLGRMNFLAWMVFVPLWLTFSYTVGAFSVWGGGFLYALGVIDYSGGYVIHVSSGTAGFVAAYWLGPRSQRDRDTFYPNNLLVVLIGAGILWVGWNGTLLTLTYTLILKPSITNNIYRLQWRRSLCRFS